MLRQLQRLYTQCYIWAYNIPFNLRLTFLSWRYGKGNIPADKLPQITFKDPEEARLVGRIFLCCGYLDKILKHYRVPIEDSQTAFLFSKLLNGEFLEAEDEHRLLSAIRAEHPAVMLLELVHAYGDISDAKKQFFNAPPPFESMKAWALSLEHNRR